MWLERAIKSCRFLEILEQQIGARKRAMKTTGASFEILKNKNKEPRHICCT
jgi:hypothetical protein